jgi:glycogen operon protein
VDGTADIAWLTPAGDDMTDADWRASYAKSVAVFLNGSAITELDPRGDRVTDRKFLLLFNAGPDPITFTIPEARLGTDWEIVIDTEDRRGDPQDAIGFLPRPRSRSPGTPSSCCARGRRPPPASLKPLYLPLRRINSAVRCQLTGRSYRGISDIVSLSTNFR